MTINSVGLWLERQAGVTVTQSDYLTATSLLDTEVFSLNI